MASYVLAAVYFTLSGTTVTVVKSQNVSSVVRNSTGQYTINFSSALADANYMALMTCRGAGSYTDALECAASRNTTSGKNTYSTSSIDVVCFGPKNSPAVAEAERVCVLILDAATADADVAAMWTVAGAAVTVQHQTNVSSITRNLAGVFTLNFNSALADANYSMFCGSRVADGAGELSFISNGDRNPTGSLNLHTSSAFTNLAGLDNNGDAGTVSDPVKASAMARKASRTGTGILAAVRFSISGTTCTVVDQQNVASVTYISTGVYKVNFTSNLADTNWVPICAGKWGDVAGSNNAPWVGVPGVGGTDHTLTTSAVTVATRFFQNSGPFDASTIDVWIVDASLLGTTPGETSTGVLTFPGVAFNAAATDSHTGTGILTFAGVSFAGVSGLGPSTAGNLAFSGISFSARANDTMAHGLMSFAGISFAASVGLGPSTSGTLAFQGVSFAGVSRVSHTAVGAMHFAGISIIASALDFPAAGLGRRSFWTFGA